MKKQMNVALYCRLSRDDKNANSESISIENQRKHLTQYVEERGWRIHDYYIDDGWTGTNFDRPDFKRLLEDIDKNLIDCIVVKDLSRFGRNYTLTGYYTDIYLLEKGIRFISINDMFDNMNDDNGLSGMYNVMNEFYPKTVSKNVRQVVAARASEGKYMNSHAPYGYVKSPEDKHVFIPDKVVAPNVLRMFEMFAAGRTGSEIAQTFNDEGIPSPRAYYYLNRGKPNPKKHEVNVWGSNTIMQMLKNEAYIGNLIQCKRRVLSFKTKKRISTDPSEWIRVDGTHEAIVSNELWTAVQEILKSSARVMTTKKRAIAIFSGLVFCQDCGSSMAASERGSTKKHISYRCGRYTVYGNKVCSTHNIRESLLQKIVLSDIQKYATIASGDQERLIKHILDAMRKGESGEIESSEGMLEKIVARIDEINEIVKSLYKDKVSGEIPAHMANKMLADFSNELSELEKKRETLQKPLQEQRDKKCDVRRWTDLIRKYANINEVTRSIAVELIESITVSAIYEVDGEKTQDVTIKYRFIGNLDELALADDNAA